MHETQGYLCYNGAGNPIDGMKANPGFSNGRPDAEQFREGAVRSLGLQGAVAPLGEDCPWPI
ncbi:MAG: hypothetical protein LBU32_03065 [Clostridiales bacterium]|nr:hypothetical protein [Clostridiales bacterium]